MGMICEIAPAKINLFLDVLRKRPDGYHDLKMVMQTVSLYDTVHLYRIDTGIEVTCMCPGVPDGEANIAFKAAKLMFDHFRLPEGIRITVEKRIPAAAGLAGGSADAAAVIKGINKLFDLGLEIGTLAQLGKEVGADVPFCIMGGTYIAEGIGEILTPLKPFLQVPIVLAKPGFSVSTAYVFSKYGNSNCTCSKDIMRLQDAVQRHDISEVGSSLFNALEQVTAEEFAEIREIKAVLNEKGASGSLMSGSGPSVFGLFEDEETAQNAYDILKNMYKDTYLLQTCR